MEQPIPEKILVVDDHELILQGTLEISSNSRYFFRKWVTKNYFSFSYLHLPTPKTFDRNYGS